VESILPEMRTSVDYQALRQRLGWLLSRIIIGPSIDCWWWTILCPLPLGERPYRPTFGFENFAHVLLAACCTYDAYRPIYVHRHYTQRSCSTCRVLILSCSSLSTPKKEVTLYVCQSDYSTMATHEKLLVRGYVAQWKRSYIRGSGTETNKHRGK